MAANYLDVINRAIFEHSYIRQNAQQVAESVNDIQALFQLQQTHAAWAQSSVDTLAEKQKGLGEVIKRLHDGLEKHFNFEEESFPPLLGDILMKWLLTEHHEVRVELEEAGAIIGAAELGDASQQELLSQRSRLQQIIGNMTELINRHSSDEEQLLKMVKKGLEGVGGQPG